MLLTESLPLLLLPSSLALRATVSVITPGFGPCTNDRPAQQRQATENSAHTNSRGGTSAHKPERGFERNGPSDNAKHTVTHIPLEP